MLAFAFHEYSHALMADKLGDPTARQLGRLTLNPASHLDPIGFILLIVAGFGWGKPVPFNPANFVNPKRDVALVAFAGPLSNFVLATFSAFVLNFIHPSGMLSQFLYTFAYLNLALGFFNLIPVHPLDGFKVVMGLLPMKLALQWQQIESYGSMILLIIVVTGSTSKLIDPFIDISLSLLGLS